MFCGLIYTWGGFDKYVGFGCNRYLDVICTVRYMSRRTYILICLLYLRAEADSFDEENACSDEAFIVLDSHTTALPLIREE